MRLRAKWFGSVVALAAGVAGANVRTAAIFGDHMVLQRDASVPVWGWADPGEQVTVQIAGQAASAIAGADGKWLAKLNSLPVTKEPTTMTVAGKNTITYNDVLVGDVWICAGQSNMGYSMGGIKNAQEELKKVNDDDLRLFTVDGKVSFDVQADCKGSWQHCTPGSAINFTAVGYFFGRDLRKSLKIPVGLIHSSMGGSSAQAWTTRAGLEAVPSLKPLLDDYDRDLPKLKAQTEKYDTETLPKFKADMADWQKRNAEAGKKYQADVKAAQAAGQPAPPKQPPTPNRPGINAPPNRMTPMTLNNAMLQPLLPLAIKGVAWYQGENNALTAKYYKALFPAMVADWRKSFGQGDFPFVFVQLSDGGDVWPHVKYPLYAILREAQLDALKTIPNSAMAVSFDVGDPKNVHYPNKQPVGERVALAARHLVYGEDIACSGPIYDGMTVEGGRIRIKFKFADGLMAGVPTDHAAADPAPAGTALKDFQIAGADKKFVPAEATIDGDSLIVSADGVADPKAVRYSWSDNPDGNLYNKAGLPASPFRTDDWEP